MATRSAAKAHRQSIKRRLRNRAVKTETKTAIKRATESIAGGDISAARDAVRAALSILDRAAKKGVIHPNNAGRRKSRLLLKYNAAVAAMQVPAEAPSAKAPTAKVQAAKTPAAKAPSAKEKPAKKAAERPPAKKTKK